MIKRFFSMRRDREDLRTGRDVGDFYVGLGDQFDDDRRRVLVAASASVRVTRSLEQNLSSRPELSVLFDRRAYTSV